MYSITPSYNAFKQQQKKIFLSKLIQFEVFFFFKKKVTILNLLMMSLLTVAKGVIAE